MHAACGGDGDSSSTSSSSTTATGSTGTSSQACTTCLQDAALATGCKDKTTACLSDNGAGGAGGAGSTSGSAMCSHCYDWALTCQSKSLEECAAAQSGLCADSKTLATTLQACTCDACKTECAGTQCM
jgi:hypothetical protein